jgi:hypothetical protein
LLKEKVVFYWRIALVLRFIVIATIACIGLSLACSPASAEGPEKASAKTTSEKLEKAEKTPLPADTRRTRLSTRDRWRGAPYLRRSTDETLRSHALDVALPPANSAFQGGSNLHPGGVFVSDIDGVRREALDMALPPANSAFVGGSLGGGVGF